MKTGWTGEAGLCLVALGHARRPAADRRRVERACAGGTTARPCSTMASPNRPPTPAKRPARGCSTSPTAPNCCGSWRPACPPPCPLHRPTRARRRCRWPPGVARAHPQSRPPRTPAARPPAIPSGPGDQPAPASPSASPPQTSTNQTTVAGADPRRRAASPSLRCPGCWPRCCWGWWCSTPGCAGAPPASPARPAQAAQSAEGTTATLSALASPSEAALPDMEVRPLPAETRPCPAAPYSRPAMLDTDAPAGPEEFTDLEESIQNPQADRGPRPWRATLLAHDDPALHAQRAVAMAVRGYEGSCLAEFLITLDINPDFDFSVIDGFYDMPPPATWPWPGLYQAGTLPLCPRPAPTGPRTIPRRPLPRPLPHSLDDTAEVRSKK